MSFLCAALAKSHREQMRVEIRKICTKRRDKGEDNKYCRT